LAAAGDTDLDEQLAVSASGPVEDLNPGMPVTILFGTESGNAELVAEELGTVLGQLPDVEVSDLSSVSPSDLCPERFYLLVCSTYGDGDVPSSATRFYDDLRDQPVDLDGVRFAVFGMGDASYTKTYSRGSELITEALEVQGATRVGEYGRHDAGGPVPATEAAGEWVEGVLRSLSEELSPV
jgi:sulfite reductase alpha subunit-like flavoprotein